MRLADTARPVPEQQMESRQGSPRYPKVKYLQLWKNELEPNPFKLLQRRYPIKQIQYSAKTINWTFFKVCLSWHDFLYCFCKIERNTQIRKHRPPFPCRALESLESYINFQLFVLSWRLEICGSLLTNSSNSLSRQEIKEFKEALQEETALNRAQEELKNTQYVLWKQPPSPWIRGVFKTKNCRTEKNQWAHIKRKGETKDCTLCLYVHVNAPHAPGIKTSRVGKKKG